MYRNHIEKLARARLDDILLDEGLLERAAAEDALAEQEVTGRLLSEILFERQAIDEWDLAKIVATHYAIPFIDVKAYDIPREARDLLPRQFCRERLIIPVDTFGHTATFAVVEMPRVELIAEIERVSGKAPFLYVGVRRPIIDILDEWDAVDRKKSGRPEPTKTEPKQVKGAAPATAAAPASNADPDPSDATEGPARIELIAPPPTEPDPEPTAHIAPPNAGLLGPLPAVTLALGRAPAGVGVDVATAGRIGRMASRPAAAAETPAAGEPAESNEPAAPAVPAPSGDWQSIFDEADGSAS